MFRNEQSFLPVLRYGSPLATSGRAWRRQTRHPLSALRVRSSGRGPAHGRCVLVLWGTYFTREHPAYVEDVERRAEDPRSLNNQILDHLESNLPLRGTRLLDVGCGGGELVIAPRKRGAEIVGLDISPFAAGHGQRFGLDVRQGTLGTADFGERTFDVICMIDMLEHSLHPRSDVRAAARLLRPNGVLCILTPNFRAYRVWGRRWHGFQASYEHMLFFCPRSLRILLHDFDFAVAEQDTYFVPARDLCNRVLSNRVLRPMLAEHRLLVIARRQTLSLSTS